MEQVRTNREKAINVVPDFLAWLQEVEQAGFDYVAAITRRESNLIAMIDAQTGGLKRLGRIYITDNALLVKAEEMSLSIMPRRMGKYYSKFFRFAQFYWREENFPQRAEAYFRDVIFRGADGPEARRYAGDARKFAELIQEHRDIVGSMLNWRSLYEEQEEE